MTTFWCEHAVLPGGLRRSVRVLTERGRIVEVLVDTAREDEDVTLRGVVLPGMANAHSHAFHRALRGRTHADGGNFWTWREAMYDVTRRLDPDRYLALARAVFAEMVLAGYTVVGEFHYLHHGPDGRPYDDPNAMGEAIIRAAHGAGIRLTLLDTLYLSGGLTASGHLPLDEVQVRFSDGSVEAWAERVSALSGDARMRVGAAVHSVRAVPCDDLTAVAAVTEAGSRPLHVHLSEQPGENHACQGFYGCSPTELLATVFDRLGVATGIDPFAIMAVAEEVVARYIPRTPIPDRDAITLGYAGAYSSFLLHAHRASERYGVPAHEILLEVGRRGYVGGQEDMLIDIGLSLAAQRSEAAA